MSDYQPLTTESLPSRLGSVEAIRNRLGEAPENWSVSEVGDGNLNLVFIVSSPQASVVVKQALPYIRVVGEGWPLTTRRTYFEYHALTRQQRMDPLRVPEIYHFDEVQAYIVMEHLDPHKILRHSFMHGKVHESLAQCIGQFTARTAFYSSDLAMDAHERKADMALFAQNAPMVELTENVVFTEPYYEAEGNHHTSPQLDSQVTELRADVNLLVQSQHLKHSFCSQMECLMHGDLHTGSIMAHDNDIKIIDPEFACYGPSGFDVGMYLANLFMAYFAQVGYEQSSGDRDEYRKWLLRQCQQTWSEFSDEYTRLWTSERSGILYPHRVFSQFGKEHSAEFALTHRLQALWQSVLGFAGVEIHRRILGIAHIPEFDNIEDAQVRANGESRAIQLGRHLIVNRHYIGDMRSVNLMAEQLQKQAMM